MTAPPIASTLHSSTIRDKSDLYRLITQALPNGAIFVVDEELRYVLADGPELIAAGLDGADFEGAFVRDRVPPALIEQCEMDYRTALSGATFMREHAVGRRQYRTYGLPLELPEEPRRLALAVSYEVSAQMAHVRQLKVLSSLEQIGSAVSTVGGIVAAISELSRENFGPSTCVIAEVNQRDNTLRELTSVLSQMAEPILLVPQCLEADDLDALLAAAGTSDVIERQCTLARALGAETAIIAPRMVNDQLAGIIAVVPAGTHAYDADDIELLRLIAGAMWNLIERCQFNLGVAASARAKERFLAVLGHELRTPLSTLGSALTLLGHHMPSRQAQDIAAVMDRQLKQMNSIVNDLLGLSQLSLETLDIRKQPCNPNEIAGAVASALAGVASRKQQKIEYFPSNTQVSIVGDAPKLTQVFTNLVNNAIKYTLPGGAIRIAVEATPSAGTVAVSVRDTGIGIAEEQISDLFNLFERGDPARLSKLPEAGDGLGVGLWIAKRFVEAHGGELTVFSEGMGLGSTFTVTLPMSQAAFPARQKSI